MNLTYHRTFVIAVSLLLSGLFQPNQAMADKIEAVASIRVTSPVTASLLTAMNFTGIECNDLHKKPHRKIPTSGNHNCEVTITPPTALSFKGDFENISAISFQAAQFTIMGEPHYKYRIELPDIKTILVTGDAGQTESVTASDFTADSKQRANILSRVLDASGNDTVSVGATLSIPPHFKQAEDAEIDINLIIYYE